jgi:hypothetical protein
VVVCLALVLACAGGASAARAVRPLSNAEFQQLRHAQSRIRSLESSDARGVVKATAVCTHMRSVSRLIAAVRRGCLDLITLGGDDARLNARATKCGIDPSSEVAILTCMVPPVRAYSRDAEAFYRAESNVDRLARQRGFSRGCIAVIGDSRGNIAAERRLAAALKAATQALENQNPDALQTLSAQIQAAVKAIKPGPSSLAVCPHQ